MTNEHTQFVRHVVRVIMIPNTNCTTSFFLTSGTVWDSARVYEAWEDRTGRNQRQGPQSAGRRYLRGLPGWVQGVHWGNLWLLESQWSCKWNVYNWHQLMAVTLETLHNFLSTYDFLCLKSFIIELPHNKANKMTCAPSEDLAQPVHPPSLISLHCVLSG